MKYLLKTVIVALAVFGLSFAYSQDEAPCDGAMGNPHPNGGGFVAYTATVDKTAYVDPEAQVCDVTKVGYYVRITGRTRLAGNTVIPGRDLSSVYEDFNYLLALLKDQIDEQNSGDERVAGYAQMYDYNRPQFYNELRRNYDHVWNDTDKYTRIPGDPQDGFDEDTRIPGDTQVY